MKYKKEDLAGLTLDQVYNLDKDNFELDPELKAALTQKASGDIANDWELVLLEGTDYLNSGPEIEPAKQAETVSPEPSQLKSESPEPATPDTNKRTEAQKTDDLKTVNNYFNAYKSDLSDAAKNMSEQDQAIIRQSIEQMNVSQEKFNNAIKENDYVTVGQEFNYIRTLASQDGLTENKAAGADAAIEMLKEDIHQVDLAARASIAKPAEAASPDMQTPSQPEAAVKPEAQKTAEVESPKQEPATSSSPEALAGSKADTSDLYNDTVETIKAFPEAMKDGFMRTFDLNSEGASSAPEAVNSASKEQSESGLYQEVVETIKGTPKALQEGFMRTFGMDSATAEVGEAASAEVTPPQPEVAVSSEIKGAPQVASQSSAFVTRSSGGGGAGGKLPEKEVPTPSLAKLDGDRADNVAQGPTAVSKGDNPVEKGQVSQSSSADVPTKGADSFRAVGSGDNSEKGVAVEAGQPSNAKPVDVPTKGAEGFRAVEKGDSSEKGAPQIKADAVSKESEVAKAVPAKSPSNAGSKDKQEIKTANQPDLSKYESLAAAVQANGGALTDKVNHNDDKAFNQIAQAAGVKGIDDQDVIKTADAKSIQEHGAKLADMLRNNADLKDLEKAGSDLSGAIETAQGKAVNVGKSGVDPSQLAADSSKEPAVSRG